MNETTGNPDADRDATLAALDRLDAALARIARVRYHPPAPVPRVAETAWAEDFATRLDVLIAELRRALAGEQS